MLIKTVVRTKNDMVMVFSAEGEQIPEYQGQYEEVKERVLRDATEGTVFNHWFRRSLEPMAIPGGDW